MIKVIPQTANIPNKLTQMKVGDRIMLELVFDENQFSMHSILVVTELDKTNQKGEAQLQEVPRNNKTFNDYSNYYGLLIPFSYTDICDVDI